MKKSKKKNRLAHRTENLLVFNIYFILSFGETSKNEKNKTKKRTKKQHLDRRNSRNSQYNSYCLYYFDYKSLFC